MKKLGYLLTLSIVLSFLTCKREIGSYTINPTLDFAQFTPYVPDINNIIKTYYVDGNNTNANDENDGSEESPWLTITHAAESVFPGAKIIVKSGTYPEKISIETDGRLDAPIIFEAEGEVVTYNFRIFGNCVSVYGFKITRPSDYNDWRKSGIWIDADYVHVDNNTITDFISECGIQGQWGEEYSSNVHVSNNYIYKCNKGIGINGNKWYVVNNEIERLYRGTDGGDADNMRYFGDTIIIRNNYMHGTFEDEIGESHVDLFQTFDDNGEEVYNVLIEKNIGTGFFHQGIMASSVVSKENHQNLWVMNNVFANSGAWGLCIYNHLNVHVINNTFFNCKYHGVGFNEESTGEIKNNLFYNTPSGYWKDETSSYQNGNNLLFHEERIYDELDFSPNDILNQDPMFVDQNNILGPDGIPFTEDDGLNLQEESPARNAAEDEGNIGAY